VIVLVVEEDDVNELEVTSELAGMDLEVVGEVADNDEIGKDVVDWD
jgi:hypothetical protein